VVVEDQSEWIDQMNGHEIVDHEEKTQHVDRKVGVVVGNSRVACHTINKECKLLEK